MKTPSNGTAPRIKCPYCGESERVRRSHRKNFYERLVSLFGKLPYRCNECGRRFMLRSRRPERLEHGSR